MWRRRSDPSDDPDTDVSISEDEDFDEGSSSYCVSLGGGNSQKHQDGIQVLFQLERLRGTPVSIDGGVATSVTRSNLQSQADGCDALQKVQDPAEKSEKFVAKKIEYPSADELEDFDEQHGNRSVLMLPNTTTFPGGHVRQSIADFLDGLQEKTTLPGNLMTGKKRKKVSSGGDIETEVADAKFLDELMPDPIGSTSCSSGEESNHNTYNLPRSHHDRSIMTERFQEILNSTSLTNVDSLYSVQKTSSSGIFGQLQRVIQSQKDADIEFLKMMQEGGCCDKTFGDVLILSKQLDAKLTVCQCSLVGNQENPLSSQDLEANYTTRERTIIFSPRVCNSVDLEVGNLIRIYPPWSGVRLGKGHDHKQSMILCTYYSQVSALTVPEI